MVYDNDMKVEDLRHVDRTKARLISEDSESSDFVDLPAARCVELAWEITCEAWSLKDKSVVQQRLQRDVAVLKEQ